MRNAKRATAAVTAKLRSYYERVSGRWISYQGYMVRMSSHIMCHILMQQMKNAELMDNEIVEMFGWCTPSIIGSWYVTMSEKRRRDLARSCCMGYYIGDTC